MKKEKPDSDVIGRGDVIKTVLVGVLISIIMLSCFRLTKVSGESMESTLRDGQRLMLTKVTYWFSDPDRGDIVVVYPEKINVDAIIKRVIGVPGDKIAIKNNVLYLNGEALQEDYIKEEMKTADIEEFTLGEDEYFICGDNRNNSLDSRSEILGPVHRDEIYGKIFMKLF